jgi:ferric-dicitrate binding protein FerR (iron transport regulator)
MSCEKNAEEAGRWFAALRRGIMSTEECSAYEAWQRKPENSKAIASMKDLWALLGSAPGLALLSKRTRGAIVSVVLVASIVIAAISVIDSNHFWTTLDWANR